MELRSVTQIDWRELTKGPFYPSPIAWEDQVLYFLMLDRFSDGKETGFLDNNNQRVTTGTTPPWRPDLPTLSRQDWESGAQGWKGGNLKGLTTKLGYLKRMGITAIWISPVFKQVAFQDTYHGYGVQDFLEIDPHFGTTQDLKDLVKAAHSLGILVILDIILNHSGDVFAYNPDRYPAIDANGHPYMDPRWDRNTYPVSGFRNHTGNPNIPFTSSPSATSKNDAIWPQELQCSGAFTRKGHISNWDYDPEYLEGDFCDLKDIHHGGGHIDSYQPSPFLEALSDCYKYWIAACDIDGFRVDTVKHMELGATRYFASVIHEFAQSLHKENFYLIGEITGGRERAFDTLETTGLDAALGIDDIPDKMEYLVKGYRNPSDYFNLFRNSVLVDKDSHTWFRKTVVTLYDDHDQVRKGRLKARFCANDRGDKVVLNVMALNATTLGIPCIYYGSEQSFNGKGIKDQDGNDVFLRECMFGGAFGSKQSQGAHFFDESSPVYQEFSKILKIRDSRITLRRGRQYLREISGDGVNFGLPTTLGNEIRSVIPWSRILSTTETLLAINTDYDQPRTAWVTIDNGLHATGDSLVCCYSTDPNQIGKKIKIEAKNGKAVLLTVPAAGFVIFE